jgi:hypothetical protein
MHMHKLKNTHTHTYTHVTLMPLSTHLRQAKPLPAGQAALAEIARAKATAAKAAPPASADNKASSDAKRVRAPRL